MASNNVIVIGGGLAAGTLASQLRQGGHDGAITIFAAEPHAPYERPPLSKDFLLGQAPLSQALVHDEDWYTDHNVTVHSGVAADAIDVGVKTVSAGGHSYHYDQLVIATGAQPRRLSLADNSGAEVHYLRSWADAEALDAALTTAKSAAIIGAGWIGLEVAAAARQRELHVTVFEAAALPLLGVMGEDVAQIFADLHREHGVELQLGVTVSDIRAEGDGVVIELADGSTTTAEVLVIGIGVEPTVKLAQTAGLSVDNGIRVDDHLRTSAADVWAMGDVAYADHAALGIPLRVEHWDVAIQHAKVVAANLSGTDTTWEALPYFFTDQYDFGMEYVGNPGPEGFDQVIISGDPANKLFRAWWLRGNRVVAGMHANDWDAIDQVRAIVGTKVDPAELARG